VKYVDYLISCFGVMWEEDDECFKITIKRDKEDHRKPIFNKKNFYELSKHIDLDNHKEADDFLKKVLNNMLKFYNSQIRL